MTLKERWEARETKIGKWIKNWIGKFLILCSALGGANEYLQVIPLDWIPTWLKTCILIAGIIGFLAGKMSVKPGTVARLLLFAFLLISCGPAAKLRRAERLMKEAIAKGAKVKSDTVYQDREKLIKGPSTTVTLPGSVIRRDTTIYQDKIKIRDHWQHDTLYQYVQCPDSVIKWKERTAINETIECPPENHTWRTIALCCGGLFILLFGVLLIRR